MNAESGKCLDLRAWSPRVETLDCNQSTANRWKLMNGAKQLCNIKSDQCISVPIQGGKMFQMIYLSPMLGGESGEKNCKDCWSVQKQFT